MKTVDDRGVGRSGWRKILAMWLSLASCASGVMAGPQEGKIEKPVHADATWNRAALGEPFLPDPIWVYNDWSAYDELSDNIPLTEALAMRELDEIVRLKTYGVHFDYFMMDAFWFDPDGGYRKWRTPNWPDGPDRWIAACQKNGLKPGMWFGTNELVKINAAPQWKESLTAKGGSLSFSEGGFLADFMNVLQYWHDRGIRMFKFDFVDFDAATPATEARESKTQIRDKNQTAFREALQAFRTKNPDVTLVAFNGFGGDMESTSGPFPFRNPLDLRWLTVFDSIYSGDPRPSDVPEVNFWRSMDIYSDHMVRRYEQSGMPLERIDSTGMMIGNTGTIYYRKTNAWKGMLWGMVARGGWVNTIHGNLEFLDERKAKWFAKVQKVFEPLQAEGRTKTFGGIPGEVAPYGFGSLDATGALYTVVNPAQEPREIALPLLTRKQTPLVGGRVVFRDAGFAPAFAGDRLTLGPGQMAAVGFGRYAAADMDFGVQEDVNIPLSSVPIEAKFSAGDDGAVEAQVDPPASGNVRILFQQRDEHGNVFRSWPGGPPNGKRVGEVLRITVQQGGKSLPVDTQYDRQVWSGLSWGAGEVRHEDFFPTGKITIRCSTEEKGAKLEAHLYRVTYAPSKTER